MTTRFLFALFITLIGLQLSAQSEKHRVIVLTDIEADPDDTQSLVRLLLYSNEIDIKGIIATTSCWMTNQIHPESIHKVLDAYEKVQPNLTIHHPDFPKADLLRTVVKSGTAAYGMAAVGEGKDTEGSDWIIRMLEEKDDRPLWISVWGGANTLAQALYKIEKTKSEKEATRLISKLRVYTISDQDDSGYWIREEFPELFYIVSPGDDYGQATWMGINASYIQGIDHTAISNTWLAENIQQNHGALGASYPDVAWGMEGDTPAFLSLIRNGLNDAEHPNFGGWGGRYELTIPDHTLLNDGNSIVKIAPETRPIWTNAIDHYTPKIPNEFGRNVKDSDQYYEGYKLTIWRWRDDFQNDFAARMDWCTQTYEAANHAPVPVLNHSDEITVKSGEYFSLDAFDSYDPDEDHISFLWFNYPEAGSYNSKIEVQGAENMHNVNFIAPKVDQPETAHFILKLTDKGTPQMTAYKRVIVTIAP